MTLIPAFPLGTAYLPGDAVVLRVFESRYLDLVRVVLETDRTFLSALISSGSEVGGGDKRFDAGVLVEVDHVEQADIGLMLYGHATCAVDILEWNDEASYPRADYATQSHVDSQQMSEWNTNLVDLANKLESFFSFLSGFDIDPPCPTGFVLSLLPRHNEELSSEEYETLFWTLARLVPSTPLARYQLLAHASLNERFRLTRDEIDHLHEIVQFRYGN